MRQAWARYLPAFIKHKIEGGHQLQGVISNSAWFMGDRIIRMGVGLLVGVWLARYLGPSLYGEFNYAFAFAMMFAPVAMLGLDDIGIRELIKDPSNRDEILGTIFSLMLLGGLAVFLLATATIFLVRPDDTLTHWLVAIMTVGTIFQAFIAIEFWFESQLKWKFTVFSKHTAFLVISVIKIALILVKAPLLAFAWAGLAEIVLGSAGLVIVYRVNGYRLNTWRYSRAIAGTFLKDSWPQIFSVFLTMVYLKIDQVMLGSMAGNEELGFYSAAVRLTEAWYFIPLGICSSVFPAIVAARAADEQLFYERMQKLYNLMALISYGIAIPVMLFSNRIVELLFHSAYAKTGPLLALLIWTGLFTSLGAARNVFMVSQNWLRINLATTLLGCLMNIALNYYLIPVYGAMGAIIASLISYWFAIHGTCFIFKPLRNTGWMLAKAMIYPKIW
jgi:O-antigen/teichoic acid export membrane protein